MRAATRQKPELLQLKPVFRLFQEVTVQSLQRLKRLSLLRIMACRLLSKLQWAAEVMLFNPRPWYESRQG
jgi:hypothetical protein